MEMERSTATCITLYYTLFIICVSGPRLSNAVKFLHPLDLAVGHLIKLPRRTVLDFVLEFLYCIFSPHVISFSGLPTFLVISC